VFSDASSETDDGGRALLERTFPPVADGHVEGVGQTELPTRVVTERLADDAVAMAASNWADTERCVEVTPTRRVGEGGRCWDAFAGELVEPSTERALVARGAGVRVTTRPTTASRCDCPAPTLGTTDLSPRHVAVRTR
jgi:hypothetical protein